MNYVFPASAEEECAKCGRQVWITVSSDELDFDAPYQKSDCEDADCPVNSRNQPGPTQKVDIVFVDEEGEA